LSKTTNVNNREAKHNLNTINNINSIIVIAKFYFLNILFYKHGVRKDLKGVQGGGEREEKLGPYKKN
jgi:hypothetical protein